MEAARAHHPLSDPPQICGPAARGQKSRPQVLAEYTHSKPITSHRLTSQVGTTHAANLARAHAARPADSDEPAAEPAACSCPSLGLARLAPADPTCQ
jgi:hypothetical protein